MRRTGIIHSFATPAVVLRPRQARLGLPRQHGGTSAGRGTTAFAATFAMVASAAVLVFVQAAVAQDKTPSPKSTTAISAAAGKNAPGGGSPLAKRAKPNRSQPPLAITPEREAAVMTFVERNHAELAELLVHLKAHQIQEYERAVRELFRVTERLATIRERDTTQYELEIDLWTAQSQVQLLAARMKMGVTDELGEQLRQALGVQSDARLALLKHERERVRNRLARIEGDIEQWEANRQRTIERQLRVLTRTGGGGSAKKAPRQKKQ